MADAGKSFKSFKTLLIVASITFPILITFSVTRQNSIFDVLQEFNILTEGTQNTTNKQGTQNTAAVQAGGEKNANISESIVGPKNNSFQDGENDLSLSTTTSANDKLLDGLLVSSFDEASCISRFQSYLYRKASPHKPSKYLISKLRNYEQLHQSCGLYTKSYNETMKKGAKFSKHDVGKCRYMVWTTANGLGNRMITLVAAFLYAIITDRILLVRFEADMLNLFCEPFPNTSWLLPKNSPYWNDLRQFETLESMSMNKKGNSSDELLPSVLVLDLTHTHVGHTNVFHCDQSQDLLQKIPALILWSNQYFVPSLFMISSFREELSKMFPDKDTVFHHLGRYLFHPSNEAWEQIQKLYEAHLAKENERIGLQIRVFNEHQAPQQTIINEIISCAHQNKLLPKFNMQSSMTSPLKNHTSKVVLVVSLYSKYGEKLKTMYQANTTLSREVIKVYQPSHEEHQKSDDDKHNIKAWTEIYLLSLCDALVTSPMSTFGYVAHSLGGLKPWILKSVYGEIIPDPPCQRATYMEPCFHYPPKYDCRSNTTIDFTSLFNHIRHCEDVSSGLKVANAYD